MEGASRRVSHGGCLLRMPVGKVPTEELFMEGTRSGGSYGEVSSQQDHRSKHYSSRSKHHNHNYTHYSPAANIIIPTTHVIALAASIIARDTPYLKK